MKKNITWFTLIELIIVMTITAILAIGASRINLSQIAEAQKVWIFLNKINSNITTAINNSLIWKWINANIDTPKFWKININSNWNWNWYWTWNIIVSYWSWTFQTASWLTIKAPKFYQITNIKCSNLDNTNSTSENNINLYVQNWDITLSWCTNTNAKILNFDVLYKNFKKHVKINSVNNILNSN